MIVWWATEIEVVSALARRHRDGHLSEAELAQGRSLLAELTDSWSVVHPTVRLRSVAERLLLVHLLRAANALQLAAALAWVDGDPEQNHFICLDERLRVAAQREGFSVLRATPSTD